MNHVPQTASRADFFGNPLTIGRITVDALCREAHHDASPTLAHWRDAPEALAKHASVIWLAVMSGAG